MIDLAEELHHLISARRNEPSLPEPDFVVQVEVRCSGDAPAVLKRVRELLGLVIRHRLEHPPDDEAELELGPFSVDVVYWSAVLPPWFVARTPFASASRVAEEWTVESWLYWFLSADEDRAWRWVSASVASPTRVVVVIQVADLPLAWDDLRWAFLSAGAESAEL